MRKKARGGSWQVREGSEGSSWVDAGRPPLSRQERDPGGAGPGRSRNGGRKAGGTEGEGIRSRSHGRGIFSGPFAPPRSQARNPPTVLIVPRPGERIPRCVKCAAAGRGRGDRGLCPFCGRIGVREVEVSPPACRSLAGPGPFQSREASCRDNPRPPLPSFLPKTLRLGSPHPGDRPRSSHSLPEEKRGAWSSGDGPGRGQKRPEEEEDTPVFSLSSTTLSPLPHGPSPGVLFPPWGFSGDFVEESGTIGDRGDRVPNRPSPVPLCE